MINSINTASQTIEQKSSTAVHSKSPPPVEESNVVKLRQVEEKKQVEETQVPEEKNAVEEKNEGKISQAMLDELAGDIETLHSVGLSFAQHEDTGRTMVEVMDRDTQQVIRQIPAEDILDMAAKMEEMIGLLFDVKI